METPLHKTPVYAVFDIGKTNKKLIIFDEERRIIHEHLHVCTDTYDEDGYPCEHLPRLTQWVRAHWRALLENPHYVVKGVNFTAYGSAWVHLDAGGQPVLPLYSHQRPLPTACLEQFYAALEQSPDEFALATRSPNLDLLNAGLQLYWLKYARPAQFARVHTSLFLPQYLSYLITGDAYSDFTSVGGHTALWDFEQHDYHAWVYREGLVDQLAPIIQDSVSKVVDGILIGVGMLDSSAALVSHLFTCTQPFVLVATGSWCVTFNPFNKRALTPELLRQGCASYLSSRGEPVLASHLPLGLEHDYHVQRIAAHFGTPPDFYLALVAAQPAEQPVAGPATGTTAAGAGGQEWSLEAFGTAADAYQYLLHDLVNRLCATIDLVRQHEPTIYVDGGFARSPLFMRQLGSRYPEVAIRTLEFAQATAIGALIHLEQGEARKKTQPLFV